MGAVAGMATLYDLPNFVGALYEVTSSDTVLLSTTGGLNGGMNLDHTDVPWQTIDNTAPEQPAILEGADPVFEERTRTEFGNVIQIFQYGIKLTYSVQGSTRNLGVPGTPPSFPVLGDPRLASRMAEQVMLKLKRAARDVEYTYWWGEYNRPTSNSAARKMRGIINVSGLNTRDLGATVGTVTAITAASDDVTITGHGLAVSDELWLSGVGGAGAPLALNQRYFVHTVTDANNFSLKLTLSGAEIDITSNATSPNSFVFETVANVTKGDLDTLVRRMYDDSEAPFERVVIFAGAYNKQRITEIYGFAPARENVGGLSLDAIEMDIAGRVPIVLSRHMPKSMIAFLELSVIEPAFMEIPDRGHFFVEPVARTGAADSLQLYGELSLATGPAQWHGLIRGAKSDAA